MGALLDRGGLFGTFLSVAILCNAPSQAAPPVVAQWADYGLRVEGLGNGAEMVTPLATYFLNSLPTNFIRIPFTVEKPGTGAWKIEIWDTETDERVGTIASEDVEGESLPATLWSAELKVTSARLEIHGDLRDVVISIPRYLYGVESLQVENIIGTSDLQFVYAHDKGTHLYELAKPVVRLKFVEGDGYVPCTGFLISPSLVMTNEHCVDDNVSAVFADFFFEVGGPEPMEIPVFAKPVVMDPWVYDFAILRLKKVLPPDFAAPLELYDSAIVPDVRLLVIQHPNNEVKQYVRDNCAVMPESDPLIFMHTCDTKGGSSGSPMLESGGSRRVVALHQTGTGEGVEGGNTGIGMKGILMKIKENAPDIYLEVRKGGP